MDYEVVLQEYKVLEKSLKEKTSIVSKVQKALAKEMEKGDLRSFSKDILTIQDTSVNISQILKEMQELIDGFDTKSYFENGSFAQQMLSLCEENQVDVIGDFPNYEMFPYKVRFDVENQDLYMDRKKVSCMRPMNFVQKVKLGREKLVKVSFNASKFASELANAYDLALIKLGKKDYTDIYLQTLYKFLVPMSRFRKDYDQQSFAFDLARLYSEGSLELKDGRKFQFGPSRNNNKAIRILDNEGREQFLATIRFYQ